MKRPNKKLMAAREAMGRAFHKACAAYAAREMADNDWQDAQRTHRCAVDEVLRLVREEYLSEGGK